MLLGERVAVDDDRGSGFEPLAVGLERGGVHGHQYVAVVARVADPLCAEMHLESRYAGDGALRRADFGRIVREGGDAVTQQGRGVGEECAGQLHAVARVAREPDHDILQLLYVVVHTLGSVSLKYVTNIELLCDRSCLATENFSCFVSFSCASSAAGPHARPSRDRAAGGCRALSVRGPRMPCAAAPRIACGASLRHPAGYRIEFMRMLAFTSASARMRLLAISLSAWWGFWLTSLT